MDSLSSLGTDCSTPYSSPTITAEEVGSMQRPLFEDSPSEATSIAEASRERRSAVTKRRQGCEEAIYELQFKLSDSSTEVGKKEEEINNCRAQIASVHTKLFELVASVSDNLQAQAVLLKKDLQTLETWHSHLMARRSEVAQICSGLERDIRALKDEILKIETQGSDDLVAALDRWASQIEE